MSDVFSEISSIDSRSRATSSGEAYNPIWPSSVDYATNAGVRESRVEGSASAGQSGFDPAGSQPSRQRSPSNPQVTINPSLSSAAATAIFEFRRMDALNSGADPYGDDAESKFGPPTSMQSLSRVTGVGRSSNSQAGNGGASYQRISSSSVHDNSL